MSYQELINMKDIQNKADLLRIFYSSMSRDKVKLETKDRGFDCLEWFASNGITLEYGELGKSVYKYKLSRLSHMLLTHFLCKHVKKHLNVCMYFDEVANNVFAFNIDNNYKDNNTERILEVKAAVQIINDFFEKLGIEPLTYVSGRGYHIWIRINERVDNKLLIDFMGNIWIYTFLMFKQLELDKEKVCINMYPDTDATKFSLRLFGSNHMKNKEFTNVCTKEGVWNENGSWEYFADYIKNKTITVEQFNEAHTEVKRRLGKK